MPKSFTEQERAVIRQNLINACRECWNRYGYQKTNIRELAETANISTGAFYQFYESKELIFADAAQSYETALFKFWTHTWQNTPVNKDLPVELRH
jgi:AcrR family transcriptional regulator